MKKPIALALTLVLAIFLAACGSNLPDVKKSAEPGEVITFGQPDWIVLSVEGGKALLLSEKVLESKRFDSSSNDWETSEMRAYLNNAFYDATFSTQEKGEIVETNIITGGKRTSDKIFLLSEEEVNEYMGNSAYVNVKSLRAARNLSGTSWRWWIRSPSSYGSDIARYVDFDGSIFFHHFLYVRTECGVRPALWLNQ